MKFISLKNRNSGFTLIELLVVIAIIGILSSVVLASLSTARQKSRDAKRVSDLGQVQLALELYFDANQSYPVTAPIAGTANYSGAIAQLTASGTLPKSPIPPNNGIYNYRGVTAANTEASALGTVATSYGLSVTLERADNAVLSSDADDTVTAGWATAYLGNPGAGVAGGKIFTTSSTCEATSGSDQCYDIKP